MFKLKKSNTSLTLNQKLEMIKLSEKGKSKAQGGLKAKPLVPNIQQSFECKGQVLEGNENCCSRGHMNDKKVKQAYR